MIKTEDEIERERKKKIEEESSWWFGDAAATAIIRSIEAKIAIFEKYQKVIKHTHGFSE